MNNVTTVPWRVSNPLSPDHNLDQAFLLKDVFIPLNESITMVVILTMIAVLFILTGLFMLKISLREQKVDIE